MTVAPTSTRVPTSAVAPDQPGSRNLAGRLAGGIAAAVIVLTSGVVGTLVAIRGDRGVAAMTPTPNPSPSITPLTVPRPTGASVALGCDGVDADARSAARLPGQIYFYSWTDDPGCVEVRLLEDGVLFPLAAMPQDQRHTASQTITVSPDGSRVVWVTNENSDYLGDLALLVFGHPGGPRLLGGQVLPWSPPQWEADSRHIVVNTVDATFRIDTETGFSEAIAPGVIYNLLSPNGAYVVYDEGDDVVVVRSDGVPRHRATYRGGGEGGFSVQGVSNDGRYVVIGAGSSDPTRVIGGAVLLDMVAGSPAPLPVTPPVGSRIRQVVLAPDGGMLITTSTVDADDRAWIYVVSPSGVVAKQASVPDLTGPIALYRQ